MDLNCFLLVASSPEGDRSIPQPDSSLGTLIILVLVAVLLMSDSSSSETSQGESGSEKSCWIFMEMESSMHEKFKEQQ
jgi:hypothetical protein